MECYNFQGYFINHKNIIKFVKSSMILLPFWIKSNAIRMHKIRDSLIMFLYSVIVKYLIILFIDVYLVCIKLKFKKKYTNIIF